MLVREHSISLFKIIQIITICPFSGATFDQVIQRIIQRVEYIFLAVDSQEFAIEIAIVRNLKSFEYVSVQVSNTKQPVKT